MHRLVNSQGKQYFTIYFVCNKLPPSPNINFVYAVTLCAYTPRLAIWQFFRMFPYLYINHIIAIDSITTRRVITINQICEDLQKYLEL